MNIHKSKKALKRNGVLLLVYDFLLIFIILVKNKMINISEDVVFSAMISLAGGMMIDLLWIIDSKKWIVDLKKRKYIWLYWLGKVVIFIFLGAVMISDLAFIGAVILYVFETYRLFGIVCLLRNV